MFETFINFTLVEVDTLKKYIEQEDWAIVSAVGHKVKPAFSMVGLTDLHEKMEHFEKKAKADPDKIQLLDDFKEIQEQLELFLPILRADLAAMLTLIWKTKLKL